MSSRAPFCTYYSFSIVDAPTNVLIELNIHCAYATSIASKAQCSPIYSRSPLNPITEADWGLIMSNLSSFISDQLRANLLISGSYFQFPFWSQILWH